MTIVEFINARLDTVEQAARAATPGPWWWDRAQGGDWGAQGPTLESKVKPEESVIAGWGHDAWGLYVEDADGDHIARHNPARVLREVEAKRRIVELHSIVHRNIGWLEDGDDEYDEIPVCGLCVSKHSHYQRREEVPEGPCLTLRLLALPYADHPDYQEDWRP